MDISTVHNSVDVVLHDIICIFFLGAVLALFVETIKLP